MKNILIDVGHPAHVHLFKHFIPYLKKKGHSVTVVSRDKDLTLDLLNSFGIDHICISSRKSGVLSLMAELIKRDFAVFKLHKKNKFDLAFGTSVSIAHLDALTKVKSYILEEDDDDIISLFSNITYPFATGIIVPKNHRFKKWKKKRIFHNSLHELAYLHPDHFSPNQDVLKKYKLDPYNYIVLRLSSFQAHHDWSEKGMTKDIWGRVNHLIGNYRIINSHEKKTQGDIDPSDMHDLLNYAKLIVSDSQTMSLEAACLGVPSVRYNSFVGRISLLQELEHEFGLTYGFRPGEEKAMLKKISELLSEKNLKENWQNKRKILLDKKVNFHKWMVQFFESIQ